MLAPLHVVVTNTADGEDIFESKVGQEGKVYDLDCEALIRLICVRQGAEQKRLEYKG